ncbi:coiled-coil domain-containing protein-domain-containing protein, partial [Geopyxis carbonaria]
LRYIQHHDSSYFSSPDLELADPLLYDRLIRQFLTPAEREAQGRERGWSGVLEADLTRAEAKVAAIADSEADTEARAENGRGEQVETKEEGEELWRKVMTLRFIEGKDIDVDYAEIDGNEEWDDIETEKREEEEKYFDAETPSSVTGAEDTGIQDY